MIMTQEEKAKAYDEALEKAKAHINNKGIGDTVDLCKHLFPELRESEDERMMKNIRLALLSVEDAFWRTHGLTAKEAISYLEKQKEQKHPNGCFTCDEYKKGYEEGRRNGFTAGYNKAMKEVEQKEQKPAWSEEDERMLSRCIKSIECSKMFAEAKTFKDAKDNEINWLKNRFKSLRPQPKQEWSEDDEKMLEQVVDVVYDYCPDPVAKYKLKDWLNLRFKSLRPSWKPSEEQMNALNFTITYILSTNANPIVLRDLYNDLLKLK